MVPENARERKLGGKMEGKKKLRKLNPKQPIIGHLRFLFQIKIKKFIFLREIHVRIGPLKDK